MWKGQSYWFFAPFFSFWCGKNGHEKNCTFFCGFWAHNVQWEKGVYSLSRDRPNDICSQKKAIQGDRTTSCSYRQPSLPRGARGRSKWLLKRQNSYFAVRDRAKKKVPNTTAPLAIVVVYLYQHTGKLLLFINFHENNTNFCFKSVAY